MYGAPVLDRMLASPHLASGSRTPDRPSAGVGFPSQSQDPPVPTRVRILWQRRAMAELWLCNLLEVRGWVLGASLPSLTKCRFRDCVGSSCHSKPHLTWCQCALCQETCSSWAPPYCADFQGQRRAPCTCCWIAWSQKTSSVMRSLSFEIAINTSHPASQRLTELGPGLTELE